MFSPSHGTAKAMPFQNKEFFRSQLSPHLTKETRAYGKSKYPNRGYRAEGTPTQSACSYFEPWAAVR